MYVLICEMHSMVVPENAYIPLNVYIIYMTKTHRVGDLLSISTLPTSVPQTARRTYVGIMFAYIIRCLKYICMYL